MMGVAMNGKLEAQLLCLLDDAARRAAIEGPVGVALNGSSHDAATLGLVSLYANAPVRSYSVQANQLALIAANRFGALHQFLADRSQIEVCARQDGLTLLDGSDAGPGPFADPEVQALLAGWTDHAARSALIAGALHPLLGSALLQPGDF